MFNKDFYPTPADVIEQMLHGFDVTNKVILEPSAGKGDIVSYLQNNGAKEVIACEINADLRQIVSSKCKVIADDFLHLTSAEVSHIDAIVMNPPFSADEKHILHAYAIAPAGCSIIALCNYDTYRVSHTRERRELRQAINDFGSIADLGDCFTGAERKTGVRVGLVRLQKPGQSYNSEFEGFFMEEEPEEAQANGMMPYNFVRELVNRYVAAVKLFDEQMQVGLKMHALTNTFFSGDLAFTCTTEGAPVMRATFKKDLQKSAWQWVFKQMKMEKYTTKGLKEDINKFVEQQTTIPFTMRNIYKMIEIVIGTTSGRMDRAIIEVFDKLTIHYHDNRFNVEGWKTNSHYLMGEKFIMPGICYQDRWNVGSNKIDVSSYGAETMDDMVKALCYITGSNYSDMQRFYSGITGKDYGEQLDWNFFQVKCYKKGTAHFRFKDRDVWAMFNQHVARIKGYPLPEGMKYSKAA